MGRQVNFYMMPEDLPELEALLHARGDLIFLRTRMSGPQPHEETSLELLPGDFGMRYLARPQDVGLLRIRHVPEQGDYAIVASQSPIVEFARCRFSPEADKLYAGRMYVATVAPVRSGSDDAATEFLKWAQSLFHVIRRNSNFSPMKEPSMRGFYVSRRAQMWRDQGGLLV
jgi:hypothetical protein